MTVVCRIAVAVVGLSIIACGGASELTVPVGVPPRGVLTTDSIGYHARRAAGTGGEAMYGFRLIARYENATSALVYLQRCRVGSSSLTYAITGVDHRYDWAAYSPFNSCSEVNDFIAVRPGEVRIDTISALGSTAVNSLTHARHAVEGRFQLYYTARLCADVARCQVVDSLSASNPFVVGTVP